METKEKITTFETIHLSFRYIFDDFKKTLQYSFFPVLTITLLFNFLYFLNIKSVATNFTLIIILSLISLVITSAAQRIHLDILKGIKLNHSLISIFEIRNLKYFFLIILLTFFFTFPILVKIYLDTNSINNFFGFDNKFLIFFLIITGFVIFKFFDVLPRLSLTSIISFKLNNYSGKIFLIFLLITIIFSIPTFLIFNIQLYFITNHSDVFRILKPLFDFISFYISYLNYLVFFAGLSYLYKNYN